MSTVDFSEFIKALNNVKQGYTCGVCKDLCKEPVTLSKCFHIICAEHFKKLKTCPTCNISLDKCTTFDDTRLSSAIDSARQLDQILKSYKAKDESTASTKRSIHEQDHIATNTVSRKRTIHVDADTSTGSKKATASESKKALSDKTNASKQNVSDKPNISILSNKSILSKAAEKRNNKGETMLHIACRLGKVDRITELLNQGANTNTKDNAGWTPLHEVVQNGRLDLVRLLLQYNTLINVPGPSNETPLHEAVRYEHHEIAEELVIYGADIHIRNCKGETPYQLASADMKTTLLAAAENLIHTQSVNISHISALYSELDVDDMHIYCVSQFRTVHNKLKVLSKHHSNVHIEVKFTKKTSHLIIDCDDDKICISSLDVLQGIVGAVWILSAKWVTKSTEDKLEPFDTHEILGVGTKSCQGPKNSRYNKYKQLPGIFDGCHFYLHNFNTKYEITKSIIVTKAILTKLITDAGGIVLRRVPNPELIPEAEYLVPYHAKKGGKLVNCSHYIIYKDMYEPMYNMQHLKALPIGWLIECLEKYELCEPW